MKNPFVIFGLLGILLGILITPLFASYLTLGVYSSDIPVIRWQRTFGGSRSETVAELIQTADEGFTLIGSTHSSASLTTDLFAVKTNSLGSLEWNFTFGGDAICYGYSVAQASDEGFAFGTSLFSDDMQWYFMILKTDSNGNLQWNHTYAETNLADFITLTPSPDGGFLCAVDVFSYDLWLIKTNSTGHVQWDQLYEDSYYRYHGSAFIPTLDGGYLLTGFTSSAYISYFQFWVLKIDMNGSIEWNQTFGEDIFYEINDVCQTSDGGFAIAGKADSYGVGNYDMWLMKTDNEGVILWNQTYGGPDNDVAYSLLQTSDGGFLLAGFTNSFGARLIDAWLVKTDAMGNIEWNQTYGGTQSDSAISLIQMVNGDFAFAGSTESFGEGNSDMWLVVLTTDPIVDPSSESHFPLFPLAFFLVLVVVIFFRHKHGKLVR